MAITQKLIGHGRLVWLGVNQRRGTFSAPRNTLTIREDGIEGDMYRGGWREISDHDVDYITTDGVATGDKVLNLRQLTIVEEVEVGAAGAAAGVMIEHGMLRENMRVSFTPIVPDQTFSKLPPLSRMVIGNGDPKVLILTEENGPCRTICRPIAVHHGDTALADSLRAALKDRRGQMAMVRSGNIKEVQIGDTFKIFPPMT
jgi:hypothetical protein